MALVVSPLFLPFPSSQNQPLLPRSLSITQLRRCLSAVKVSTGEPRGTESSVAADNSTGGAAVLWYKQDLRVDDHPGLVAAASRYRMLIPLYVFDRRIIFNFSDEMLELLLLAVKDLRKSLRDQGSDLMIRFGRAEIVIPELVKEVKAKHVFAEEELEYNILKVMDNVSESLLSVPLGEWSPRVSLWNSPLYDIKNLKDLPTSYNDFKKLKLPILSPLQTPNLPDMEMGLAWGSLPTVGDLKKFMNNSPGEHRDKWASVKNMSAEDILRKDQLASPYNGSSELGDSNQRDYYYGKNWKPEKSVFLSQQGNSVAGGTSIVLNALAAYLRYLEGTTRDDWQEVHEKLCSTESREGASFGALFGSALHLGIISRRRVYYEAIKYEKERNAGFLSPFGYSAVTVAAAIDTVCSMEWYRLLAKRSQVSNEGAHAIRLWRWNGHLIQYTVAGHKGPNILLVHGFGAFLEHYRGNINSIAEVENRVWSITLLGFGRSEKPNVVYTELMWAEMLRNFIIEVVGEPVHLVGNSIGGYFVAIVAGLWQSLVKSIVLLNSAGNVIPGYSSVPNPKQERRTSGLASLAARFLLLYLRLGVRSLVKNCYPIKTYRADDWLINEMKRASYDPGSRAVMESVFSFDLSIPLNYLLKGFEDKVLVIQGTEDPIFDSYSTLAMLREHCKGIVTKELNAGHCPHDELPEEVNSLVQKWVISVESASLSSANTK